MQSFYSFLNRTTYRTVPKRVPVPTSVLLEKNYEKITVLVYSILFLFRCGKTSCKPDKMKKEKVTNLSVLANVSGKNLYGVQAKEASNMDN